VAEFEGFLSDDRIRIQNVFFEQQNTVIQRRMLLEQVWLAKSPAW
jgi:DNA-binding winged helix-turn-helix (wHTH) protein